MNKPIIEFDSYRITKIDYKVVNDSEELRKELPRHGDIKVSTGFNDDESRAVLIIETIVIDIEQQRKAIVEISGFFKVNPDEGTESNREYLEINGVAILFPYIRSIISFITSLDNEKAIILPTINTTDFGKDNKK
ncbi:hypothetical protein [Lactococcus raffinolactis]|uniref:hypothetical protein n=1 Tax=Pseudolactococcus raffinolactis TaxID=1366 RepID=UPI0039AF0B22